jgi:hypothetical protein
MACFEAMKAMNAFRSIQYSGRIGAARQRSHSFFHNAWNLDQQTLALFSNAPMDDEAYQGAIDASTFVRVFGASRRRGNREDR